MSLKIINQSFEIIAMTSTPLEMIEEAGRTCYKPKDKIDCTIPDERF